MSVNMHYIALPPGSLQPLGRNELDWRPDGRSMAVQWYLVSGDQRRRNTIHEYRIHEYCIHHTVYSAPLLARRHRQQSLTLLRFDHLLSQCSLGHNTPHFSSPRPRPFSPDPRTKVATPAPYRHRNVFMITYSSYLSTTNSCLLSTYSHRKYCGARH